MQGIFHEILSVPHDTVMDLNNVMVVYQTVVLSKCRWREEDKWAGDSWHSSKIIHPRYHR